MTVYGYVPEPPESDRLFCLFCYFIAKTEMYDRTLTDKREYYDPTSAFITLIERPYSDLYRLNLYKKIAQFADDLNIWNVDTWNKFRNPKVKKQWWIDMYEYLDEKGELDFIRNRKEFRYDM